MDAEERKQVVLSFYKTAFEEKDPEKALRLYVGDYYRQHNPTVPDQKEGFVKYVKIRVAQNPDRKVLIKRVLVDGDYVILHIHHVFAPTDEAYAQAPHGLAGIDIFRLENGKVVEHWDVLQPVPAEAVHSNTMF
jgi:predicted SnoaL-like aldol condensation-catalyzing enzyme